MMVNALCPIQMSGHGLMGVDGVDGGVLLDHARVCSSLLAGQLQGPL